MLNIRYICNNFVVSIQRYYVTILLLCLTVFRTEITDTFSILRHLNSKELSQFTKCAKDYLTTDLMKRNSDTDILRAINRGFKSEPTNIYCNFEIK